MKIILSLLAVMTVLTSAGTAQSNLQIDSYYFVRSQGLEVYLDDRMVGKSPVSVPVSTGKNSEIEFRDRSGMRVMRLQIQASRVADVHGPTPVPSWYGEAPGVAFPGFTVASASAVSRSLSISINKAKSDAIGKLARSRRGNRPASGIRGPALPDTRILACYLLFDGSGYKTYLLAGVPE